MNPMTIAGGLLGVILIVGGALALTKDGPQPVVHNGVVVNSTNSKLVMTDEDGMESSHMVTTNTDVTRDGMPCRAADLISGTRVRVTTLSSQEGVATAIEAFEKRAE